MIFEKNKDFLLSDVDLIDNKDLYTLRYQNKNYRINRKSYLTISLLKKVKNFEEVFQQLKLEGYQVSIDKIEKFYDYLIKQLKTTEARATIFGTKPKSV